jgi:hypothetical protein
MTSVTNNLNHSILALMERSELAREAGALTAAEYMELNSLANRLKFADDFNMPSFVIEDERRRFAHLKGKAFANRSAIRTGSTAKPAIRNGSLRSSRSVVHSAGELAHRLV